MEQSSTPETQELLNKVDSLIAEAAAVVDSMQRDNAVLSEQINALSNGTVKLERVVNTALDTVNEIEYSEDKDTINKLAGSNITPSELAEIEKKLTNN
jgi:chaperonin cofactor prefoldin